MLQEAPASAFDEAHNSFHSPKIVGDLAGDGVGFSSASFRNAAMTSSSPFLAAIASSKACLAPVHMTRESELRRHHDASAMLYQGIILRQRPHLKTVHEL